uniref:Uncharacterized protein n=1 Tax=Parascaris univalens TaxID=6257 RepID=A0A915CI19_PARUN
MKMEGVSEMVNGRNELQKQAQPSPKALQIYRRYVRQSSVEFVELQGSHYNSQWNSDHQQWSCHPGASGGAQNEIEEGAMANGGAPDRQWTSAEHETAIEKHDDTILDETPLQPDEQGPGEKLKRQYRKQAISGKERCTEEQAHYSLNERTAQNVENGCCQTMKFETIR